MSSKRPGCSLPTGVSVVFLIVVLGVALGLQKVTYERRTTPGQLKDVFLEMSYTSWSHWVPDSFLLLFLGGVFVTVVVDIRGYVILRRFCSLLGNLLLIRAFIIPLTSYPDPSDSCQSPDPEPSGLGLAMCSGLMYSGHTSTMVVSACVLWDAWVTEWNGYNYNDGARKCVRWLMMAVLIVLTPTGLISILMARSHYSADVAVALAFSFVMCQFYYSMIQSKEAFWRWWEADGYKQIDDRMTDARV